MDYVTHQWKGSMKMASLSPWRCHSKLLRSCSEQRQKVRPRYRHQRWQDMASWDISLWRDFFWENQQKKNQRCPTATIDDWGGIWIWLDYFLSHIFSLYVLCIGQSPSLVGDILRLSPFLLLDQVRSVGISRVHPFYITILFFSPHQILYHFGCFNPYQIVVVCWFCSEEPFLFNDHIRWPNLCWMKISGCLLLVEPRMKSWLVKFMFFKINIPSKWSCLWFKQPKLNHRFDS